MPARGPYLNGASFVIERPAFYVIPIAKSIQIGLGLVHWRKAAKKPARFVMKRAGEGSALRRLALMDSYGTAARSSGRCIAGIAVLTVGLNLGSGAAKARRIVQQQIA